MLDTAVLAVFAVNPSTPLVILPSKELTPTNIVKIIPSTHIVVEFIYLANLLICTLSDIFDIMLNAIDIKANGIIILVIIFATNVITNSIIGSSIVADVILPRC